ncbi:MAG: tRNA 5-methoxyuridine(34)/uridine 5-oxyacetic acid(34) synthase CmoB [gamma proteobacterium symbiont of Ctena orbiculata]|nr:MAG: tRNA 5-methoxyuridine(34)/uridine 5-oxyacetic acid(34) synthase CmoB [gamma proteobacterium symbiont of Ctena orbiculata]PUB78810.1 MAG: tRNA 5-methoxyuridine(34)/uridine 5-oxyacetic acid(34) synthase CmoB [gamma proteobacterium symbiont of Ctena orbiculata]
MKQQWAWRDAFMERPLGVWLDQLPHQVERIWRERPHGDLERWRRILSDLPRLSISSFDLQAPGIRAGEAGDCDQQTRERLIQLLSGLHPWRKGPYEICGIQLDTEWRSDLKWERLRRHIQPLQDRIVLDVGCGNGYHAWRMLGEGAALVIGIDPTQLFVIQFEAIRHFLGARHPVHLLPLGIEQMPPDLKAFDSVFSMGVFYHRPSPFAHLAELRGALRTGGELVLETLVIEGAGNEVLVPKGRYAKMRNVWFIPTPITLQGWLQRAGFSDVKLIDVSVTGVDEQRSTRWMRFESLADYLDPVDRSLTVEGYPAPRRAIFTARR